jgi:hypothetical protein
MWMCPNCKTGNDIEVMTCSHCKMDIQDIDDLEGILYDVPLLALKQSANSSNANISPHLQAEFKQPDQPSKRKMSEG